MLFLLYLMWFLCDVNDILTEFNHVILIGFLDLKGIFDVIFMVFQECLIWF